MFTHADFNRNGRAIGCAFISRNGHPFKATIWRFESGDIAYWVRGQFIAWPADVQLWWLQRRGAYTLFDAGQLGELGTRIDEQ